MTREEARQTLGAHVMYAAEKAQLSSACIRMIEDALDVAIKALREEPCTDAVSREAVKEWLDKWEGYLDASMIAVMKMRVGDNPAVKK